MPFTPTTLPRPLLQSIPEEEGESDASSRHSSAKDTPYGLKGAYGFSIARPNTYSGARETSRERGTLGWCPRCKAKWLDLLAELIDPWAARARGWGSLLSPPP